MNTVIEIGEFRITQDNSKYKSKLVNGEVVVKECQHFHVTLDDNGYIVTCSDCKKEITAYWYLREFFYRYDQHRERIEARACEVMESEKRTIVHRALLKIQDAWRRHKFLPCCPHCFHTIAPEDGFGNVQYRVVPRTKGIAVVNQ